MPQADLEQGVAFLRKRLHSRLDPILGKEAVDRILEWPVSTHTALSAFLNDEQVLLRDAGNCG